MKTCTKCNQSKPYSEFPKHRGRRDGYNNLCKSCKRGDYYKNADRERSRRRAKYQENIEKERAANRAYQENNRELVRQSSKNWRANNPDKMREARSNWLKNNLAKNAASAAKYHTSKKNRTPPWLTDDHFAYIESFYVHAAYLTETTGVQHCVDHIVPLQGETVSGLHVPWNLQVLTMSENSKKGNKL